MSKPCKLCVREHLLQKHCNKTLTPLHMGHWPSSWTALILGGRWIYIKWLPAPHGQLCTFLKHLQHKFKKFGIMHSEDISHLKFPYQACLLHKHQFKGQELSSYSVPLKITSNYKKGFFFLNVTCCREHLPTETSSQIARYRQCFQGRVWWAGTRQISVCHWLLTEWH